MSGLSSSVEKLWLSLCWRHAWEANTWDWKSGWPWTGGAQLQLLPLDPFPWCPVSEAAEGMGVAPYSCRPQASWGGRY